MQSHGRLESRPRYDYSRTHKAYYMLFLHMFNMDDPIIDMEQP